VLAALAEHAAIGGRVTEARGHVDQAFGLAQDGPPDPALAQLAATGLRVEADAAAAARAARDEVAVDAARQRAARIAQRVEAIAATLGAAGTGKGPPAPSRIAAFAVQCRAEAHRVEDADTADEWSVVAAAWEAIGRPYPAAAARFRAASATLRDRDPRQEATSALVAARATVAVLGARPLLAAIDTLARQARLDLDDVPPTMHAAEDDAGAGLGLTEREREILTLIAGGWSNQQIADALFISRKTASVHASNIFDKLGASNRAEAGAIAIRLGLVDRPPPPPGSAAAG
jgi:DNA-binding CsgD family transcriptional regulator